MNKLNTTYILFASMPSPASNATCVCRYKKHFQPHPTRIRRKSSRDLGYYEGEEDETNSVASMPARLRKSSTQQSSRVKFDKRHDCSTNYTIACIQAGNVHLRQNRPGAGKDRPISHPPVTHDEMEDQNPKLPPRNFNRRQSMPEMMLKEELAKMRSKGMLPVFHCP